MIKRAIYRYSTGDDMSGDFWWGMACIPAVVALVAIAVIAVMGAMWAWASWGGGTYKLYPKTLKNREVAGSIAACSKWTRYFWVPGWHVLVCRTTLATRDHSDVRKVYTDVQCAIRGALADSGLS
jgi:hypothetical protein